MEMYSKEDQYVPPILAKWLRPHQREGVEFLYQCVMGMKNYNGNGAILADDMGLGEFFSFEIVMLFQKEAMNFLHRHGH